MSWIDTLTHDPEAVYQDADFLQADYIAESAQAARDKAAGKCHHSHCTAKHEDIPPDSGMVFCFECCEVVNDPWEGCS